MTRCKYCSYNYQLKSSAYNPTGQCYELQLMAHKAMTNHLRRILTAKSVVNSGKTESKANVKRGTSSRGKISASHKRDVHFTKETLSPDVINRIAYDTKRHPQEILYRNWQSKNDNRSNSTDSSEDFSLRKERKRFNDKFRTDCEVYTRSLSSRENLREFDVKKIHTDSEERDVKFGRSDLKTMHVVIPRTRSSSEIVFPGSTPESAASFTGQTCDSTIYDRFNSDVPIYIKFVYDITKDIMEQGYYSDEEIRKVFRKHFEMNLGILNENKMLREINCLKKTLNINYDSDEKEEGEATVTNILGPEVRHIDASLKTAKHETNTNKKIDSGRRIVVTKDDVLNTLLEMDFNHEKAEEICIILEERSKDLNSNKNQVESEILETFDSFVPLKSSIQNGVKTDSKASVDNTARIVNRIHSDRSTVVSESVTENSQVDDLGVLGKEGYQIESEKQKTHKISKNSDSKLATQISGKESSVTDDNSIKNESPDIKKNCATISEQKIDKSANLCNDNSSLGNLKPGFEDNADTLDVTHGLKLDNSSAESSSKIMVGDNSMGTL